MCAVTSYSIYLTHALPIQLLRQIDARFHLPTVGTWAMMVLSSAALGYAFHRLVEVPAIRIRDKLVPRRTGTVASTPQAVVAA
jgi:peptidoglycan/LPS O-acetylase OafA/YrhL